MVITNISRQGNVILGKKNNIQENVTVGNSEKGMVNIGDNATILPGIVIGDGAVVGSGAVVTGNPAKSADSIKSKEHRDD